MRKLIFVSADMRELYFGIFLRKLSRNLFEFLKELEWFSIWRLIEIDNDWVFLSVDKWFEGLTNNFDCEIIKDSFWNLFRFEVGSQSSLIELFEKCFDKLIKPILTNILSTWNSFGVLV